MQIRVAVIQAAAFVLLIVLSGCALPEPNVKTVINEDGSTTTTKSRWGIVQESTTFHSGPTNTVRHWQLPPLIWLNESDGELATHIRQQLESQEVGQRLRSTVRECLAENGVKLTEEQFDISYTDPAKEAAKHLRLDLGAEQFVQQYGFGFISTIEYSFAPYDNQWIYRMNHGPSDVSISAIAFSDELPSRKQAQRLITALGGDTFEIGTDGMIIDGELVDMPGSHGCISELAGAVIDESGLSDIEPDFAVMQSQIFADTDYNELNAGWSACMTGSGYDFDNRANFLAHQRAKAQTLKEEGLMLRQTPKTRYEQLPDAYHQKVAAHLETEIAAAVADYECAPDIEQKQAEIANRYEELLIAKHPHLLSD